MRDQRDPGEDNSNHTKEVQNKPTHSIKVQRTDTTNRNLWDMGKQYEKFIKGIKQKLRSQEYCFLFN